MKLATPTKDTVSVQLLYQDGSIGSIQYFANGHKAIPKERLEIYCGGKIVQIDNFRMMRGHGVKGFSKLKLSRKKRKKFRLELTAAVVRHMAAGMLNPRKILR